MAELWDEDRLKTLAGVEADIRFEFVAGARLGRDTARLAELLTQEISALTNTAGGTLVLGLAEDKKKGVRRGAAWDGVPNTERWSGKRIKQIIDANLHPLLPGVTVSHIPLSAFRGKRAAIVIEVPASLTAHQAKDRRYYGRDGGQSMALHDREIRSRMERSRTSSAQITAAVRCLRRADAKGNLQELQRAWVEDAKRRLPEATGERREKLLLASTPLPEVPELAYEDRLIEYSTYVVTFTLVNNGERTLRDFDLAIEIVARNGCVAWGSDGNRPYQLYEPKEKHRELLQREVYRVSCHLPDWNRWNSRADRILPGVSFAVGGGIRVEVPEHYHVVSGDVVASWQLYREDGFPQQGEIDLAAQIP